MGVGQRELNGPHDMPRAHGPKGMHQRPAVRLRQLHDHAGFATGRLVAPETRPEGALELALLLFLGALESISRISKEFCPENTE